MDKKDGVGKRGNFVGRVVARFSPTVLGLFIVLACGGLSLAGWALTRNGNGKQEFISVEARRGDIEDLVAATGSLQPRDYVDVGAQVSGQLRKIYVEVGQSVKEGDLLAEIDAEQSAAKVEASQAQLRSLEAQLEQKRLSREKAERDLARFRNLVAEEAATVESLQNAETEAANMNAQMAQLRAQIDQLRATTRVEEANLKYTRIYAPIAGTVVSIAAKKGQTLNTNQQAPTLMRIADLAAMTVQTQVSEADVSKLRLGMDAYFTTLGGQGQRWYGKLTKVEPTPTVTNNVVLYNALFDVPNERGALMTQMTAQVFFVVAQVRDVLVVPMSALSAMAAAGAGEAGPRRRPAAGAEGAPSSVPGERVSRPLRVDEENGSERTNRRAGQGSVAGEADAPRRSRREMGPTGVAGFGAPRRRDAMVRVMSPDGRIEERKISVGVSNRIHAEVVAGLEEGEKVVAGVREPEKARAAAQSQSSMQQQMPPMPGMPGMPGGMSRGR